MILLHVLKLALEYDPVMRFRMIFYVRHIRIGVAITVQILIRLYFTLTSLQFDF